MNCWSVDIGPQLILWGALELGWPFTFVPNWNEGAYLWTLFSSQSLNSSFHFPPRLQHWDVCVLNFSKAAAFSQGTSIEGLGMIRSGARTPDSKVNESLCCEGWSVQSTAGEKITGLSHFTDALGLRMWEQKGNCIKGLYQWPIVGDTYLKHLYWGFTNVNCTLLVSYGEWSSRCLPWFIISEPEITLTKAHF